MATDTSDILELVCNRIFEQIDQSERGKWSIKTKTLMAEFGYQAARRVRQSSLDAVLDTLEEWNIEYRFPIWWKFGGNVFVDLGNVWPSLGDIDFGKTVMDYGLGLRFYMADFVVRVDMGFSKEGSRLYFNFGHIF